MALIKWGTQCHSLVTAGGWPRCELGVCCLKRTKNQKRPAQQKEVKEEQEHARAGRIS